MKEQNQNPSDMVSVIIGKTRQMKNKHKYKAQKSIPSKKNEIFSALS